MPRSIALVGCGAVARALYLPVLAKHRAEFGQVWLVDPSDHAISIASSIVAGRYASRLEDVDEEIQLAIIATANHLHFRLAHEAVSRGADVLIEKPFVIWPEEGRTLLDAASEANRLIAVNQTRRFFPIAGALRRRIHNGEFGALKSIVHAEGAKLNWAYESGAAFSPGAQRTGVIMDIGVHVIDFYQYLLGPAWSFVSATHDGFNGPEGLAEIELCANDAPVSLRLSRYAQQRNLAHLAFERAEVSFNVYEAKTYAVRTTAGKPARFAAAPGSTNYRSFGEPLVLNFLAASEKREAAVCDAASSLPVIDILDVIYREAGRYSDVIGYV
jgi:predicted dehydrogenase